MSRLLLRNFCMKAKKPSVQTAALAKNAKKEPAKEQNAADLDFDDIREEAEEMTGKVKKLVEPKFEQHNQINVAILNAHHSYGQILTFLLKQHKCLKKIFINGHGCRSIAKDCDEIDTTCRVVGYDRLKDLAKTVRAAHIVVLLDDVYECDNVKMKFDRVAHKVKQMTKICAQSAPKAVIITCVKPVCCTLPLIQAIFQETPWYHPSRIIGCISPLQMRINTYVANYLKLDPISVYVPFLGGPDLPSTVPLMSMINPDPCLSPPQIKSLVKHIKKREDNFKQRKKPKFLLSEGHAIAQFVVTVAEGLCGRKDAVTTAMVRTNIIPHVRNLVTTVRLGHVGVVENYRIPKLSKFETDLLHRNISILQERQKCMDQVIKESV